MKLFKLIDVRGWLLVGTAALCVALPLVITTFGTPAQAGAALEERKMPMKFSWVACEPNCRGWVSAVGVVTADSPEDFEDFARNRQLGGATIVLDSSGGSVNDSIALGRRFRSLGMLTTVGATVQNRTRQGSRTSVGPEAYCESMCVFLLLSGKKRFVMGASGHIAGVINPPASKKRSHWIRADGKLPKTQAEWLSGATEHPGSWWTDWSDWLKMHSGKQVAAPKSYGRGSAYKATEPAPGRYVKAKA